MRRGTNVSGTVAWPASSTSTCVNANEDARSFARASVFVCGNSRPPLAVANASANSPALAHDATTTRAFRAAALSDPPAAQNRTTSDFTDAGSRRGSFTRTIVHAGRSADAGGGKRETGGKETGSSAGGGASSPSATASARSCAVRSARRLHTTSAAKGAGAHTSTRASACVARTATMAATTVTVLPVPGGPNAQYGGPRGAPPSPATAATPSDTSRTTRHCSSFRRARNARRTRRVYGNGSAEPPVTSPSKIRPAFSKETRRTTSPREPDNFIVQVELGAVDSDDSGTSSRSIASVAGLACAASSAALCALNALTSCAKRTCARMATRGSPLIVRETHGGNAASTRPFLATTRNTATQTSAETSKGTPSSSATSFMFRP